jgi:hypothetical protein
MEHPSTQIIAEKIEQNDPDEKAMLECIRT